MRLFSTLRAVRIATLLIAMNVAAGPVFADVAPAATIVIDNFSFGPTQLSVAAGATVTWENRDDIPHTVVEDASPRTFKSPPLDSGEKFSQVFVKPGTYRYFCSLHPHMTGTIVVK